MHRGPPHVTAEAFLDGIRRNMRGAEEDRVAARAQTTIHVAEALADFQLDVVAGRLGDIVGQGREHGFEFGLVVLAGASGKNAQSVVGAMRQCRQTEYGAQNQGAWQRGEPGHICFLLDKNFGSQ